MNIELGLIIIFSVLFSSIAFADAGLPMIMTLPALLIALIPIILIETYVFRKYVNEPLKKSLFVVGLANVASTLIGYPIAWLLLLAVQFGSTALFHKLVQLHPSLSLVQPTIFTTLFSFILGSAWLAPFENEFYWMIPAAGIVNLVVAFFVSVYLEYWVERKYLSLQESTVIKKAAWRSNIASYTLLIFLLLIWLSYGLVTHKPEPLTPPNVNLVRCVSSQDLGSHKYELTVETRSGGQLVEKDGDKVLQVAWIFFEDHNSSVDPKTDELSELELVGAGNSLRFNLKLKHQGVDGHIRYPALLHAKGRTVSDELKEYHLDLDCEVDNINSLKP